MHSTRNKTPRPNLNPKPQQEPKHASRTRTQTPEPNPIPKQKQRQKTENQYPKKRTTLSNIREKEPKKEGKNVAATTQDQKQQVPEIETGGRQPGV